MINLIVLNARKLTPLNWPGLLLLNTFIFCNTSLAAEAVSEATSFEAISQFADGVIEQVMDSENLVGTSIALVYRGEQRLSRGYGLAARISEVLARLLRFGRPQENESNHYIRFAYSGIGIEDIKEGMQRLKDYFEL